MKLEGDSQFILYTLITCLGWAKHDAYPTYGIVF